MNNFAVMSIISNYCLQAFFIILKTFLIYKIYKEVKKNTRKDMEHMQRAILLSRLFYILFNICPQIIQIYFLYKIYRLVKKD